MANDTLVNLLVIVNILLGAAVFLYFVFAGWGELKRWWSFRQIAKEMKK